MRTAVGAFRLTGVLRLIDARTGETVDACLTRRGLTCVEAHVPASDPTALRVLLVADVLVRALELGGTPVWGLLSGDRDRARLRTAAALGVRPFEDRSDAGAGLGERQIIHVVGEDGVNPDGPCVAVAPAADGPGTPVGDDPAVLRLALLSRRHGDPARVDAPALDEARDTLSRWRRAVARWARRPSRPVPEEVRGRLRAAWEDDLDVPSVLRVLRYVESDPDLPDGARFETYAYADRLLGLELTRDLGAPE